MGRAPCCDKVGLKKGPWTAEEDQILINYVTQNGHGNWRALPKRAGLLRCGKSCRLRWMNYLRPDIKRGNFTPEEEETIVSLHGELGNKWSVIAARLPGRTDNEIKNVWNTHLKKRVNENGKSESGTERNEPSDSDRKVEKCWEPNSPAMQSSSDVSSEIDERFWSEVIPGDDLISFSSDFSSARIDHSLVHFANDLIMEGGGDFWYDQFHRTEDHQFMELPELL